MSCTVVAPVTTGVGDLARQSRFSIGPYPLPSLWIPNQVELHLQASLEQELKSIGPLSSPGKHQVFVGGAVDLDGCESYSRSVQDIARASRQNPAWAVTETLYSHLEAFVDNKDGLHLLWVIFS